VIDPDLFAAAAHEVSARDRHYPASVASGKLTGDEATVDFQAWHVILTLLQTGHFESIAAGGIDGQTVIGWAQAQDAADLAVKRTAQALAAAEGGSDKAQLLDVRLQQLRAIAALVARRRALFESLNTQLRADAIGRRQQVAA
jgi:hypothetical protein